MLCYLISAAIGLALPAAAARRGNGRPGYTWTGEYRGNRESIKKVGWKSFRVAGPLNDDDMKMLVQDGIEVMKCLDAWDLGEGRRQAAFARTSIRTRHSLPPM